MSTDFTIKQHLKLSPNAQIKNMVPENLQTAPALSEWKLGRIWFNSTYGKLQGVFPKIDPTTGVPIIPAELELRFIGEDTIGFSRDGTYSGDGLLDFSSTTKVADAVDDVNEVLKELAPPNATLLRGSLVPTAVTLITGKIAKQNSKATASLNFTDLKAGDEIPYIVSSSTFKAKLPTDGVVIDGKQQFQFGNADIGTIAVYMNGIKVDNGIDLGNLFHTPSRIYRDGEQGFLPEVTQTLTNQLGEKTNVIINPNKLKYKSSTGAITIDKILRYNEFSRWQRGYGSVDVHVLPGKTEIFVGHTLDSYGQTVKTDKTVIFLDPNNNAPNISIEEFKIVSGIKKYISGVSFLNTDITGEVTFKSINLFSNTYWDKPLKVQMSGTIQSNISWNNQYSNLKDKTIPEWDDLCIVSKYPLVYATPNAHANSIVFSCSGGKPTTGWGPSVIREIQTLVDTYPAKGNSNRLTETFLDEEFRLPKNIAQNGTVAEMNTHQVGIWDSTKPLPLGDAQLICGQLIKASANYAQYGIDIDYSKNSSTKQVYYRRFSSPTDKPNSNGILKITTNGVLGVDFTVFIKFPGLTAWVDPTKLYDLSTFVKFKMADGTGCSTGVTNNSGVYSLPWTLGGQSTADCNFGYIVQITLLTDTVSLQHMTESSVNWI